MISASTIQLFEKLLGMVQLKADAPDFELTAATITTARRELAEAKADLEQLEVPDRAS